MLKNNVTIKTLALTSLISFSYSFADVTADSVPINQQNHIKNEIEQTLLNSGYSPECIESLDLSCRAINSDKQILDEILIKRYYNEMKDMLTTIAPDKHLLFIEQEKKNAVFLQRQLLEIKKALA